MRACRICRDRPAGEPLPVEPNPIFVVSPQAPICVASQAPGRLAHLSSVPFRDPSGRRLRDWMGVTQAEFYDPDLVSIVPMGFCYPGRAGGGDAPPRAECRATWHRQIFARTRFRLILAIGRHSMAYHMPDLMAATLSQTIRGWRRARDVTGERGAPVLPLVHPSPRNNAWLRRNPWFEEEVVPQLRRHVRRLVEAERKTVS